MWYCLILILLNFFIQLISIFIIRIVYLEAPYAELFSWNRNRPDAVPEKALQKMIEKLDIPDIKEANSVEYVVE